VHLMLARWELGLGPVKVAGRQYYGWANPVKDISKYLNLLRLEKYKNNCSYS
jgi:hypothetical protein